VKTDLNQREAILKSATELFAKKGYGGVSSETIAEFAGTEVDAINRLFGSKAELGALWLSSVHAGSVRRHAAMLETQYTPERKIRDYFEELKPWLSRNKFLGCPFTDLGKRESLSCPRVAEEVEEHKYFIRDFLTGLASRYLGSDTAGSRLGNALFLLYSGATTEAATLRSFEPIDSALTVLDTLLPQWKAASSGSHSLS
jgi:AcrR family transcriptional regulator